MYRLGVILSMKIEPEKSHPPTKKKQKNRRAF